MAVPATHKIIPNLPRLRFFAKEIENLLARHAANLDAFVSSVLAALDSNSRFRGFQNASEEFDQGFIRAIFHRRRTKPNLQRAVKCAGNSILAGPRLHAHRKTYRSARGIFFNVQKTHHSPCAFILHRRLQLHAQFLRRAPRPIRIAQ
jgi:hypothetical protein